MRDIDTIDMHDMEVGVWNVEAAAAVAGLTAVITMYSY